MKEHLAPFLNRFFHWLTVGIGTTVMSLMMLSKGSSIETLGLIIGLYSVSIVVFEFPSGVLSDLVGQKKIYLFSLILSIIGYATVLVTNHITWLFTGFAFCGVSRAFSSGSLEALFISEYIKKQGKGTLHKFLGVLNAGEILGLAVGALLGGIIPMIWEKHLPTHNKYNGNLSLQILILVFLFFFTLLQVRDTRVNNGKNRSAARHIKESLHIACGDRNITLLMWGAITWGFCFNAIELYWQPQVLSILGSESQTWIFGIINSAYFLASLAGIGIISLILRKGFTRPNLLLFIGRISIGALIIGMSFQKGIFSFSFVYLSLFMINGMMNIPEGTLLNSLIPDEKRSSLLSLSSLMMQAGGITGSLLFSTLVGSIKISGIWILSGVIFCFSAYFLLQIRREKGCP